MARILLLIFIITFSTVAFAQLPDKFTPDLKEEYSNNDEAEVIIVLDKQFDTDKADKKNGKLAKGAYLYRELNSIADQTQQRLRSFFDENQINYQSFYIINAISVSLDEKTAVEVASFEEVRSIHHNSSLRMEEPVESDQAQQRSIEWGIENIKADSVWSEYNVRGDGVVVGGQDTGYDWDHEALKNQYRGWDSLNMTVDHDYNWHDAIDSTHELNEGEGPNPCGYELAIPCDDNSHGTHTMGTMVGDDGGSNQIGVAPEAEWIGCRNMERGWGTYDSYVECFEWFMAPYPYNSDPSNGDPFYAPDVINNSWACPIAEGCNSSNYGMMETVVENVRNAGIVVVASAGNSGPDCYSVDDPAAIYDQSFTVGATNDSDVLTSFSSRGTVTVDGSDRMKPDVAAPGNNVRSSTPDDNYASKSGTSMAGPHVAGAVALVISAVPALSGEVDTIESIFERTARPKSVSDPCGNVASGEVPNNEYGHGIIDVLAAVEEAQSPLPVRLISFTGKAEDSGNKLNWVSTAERNMSHYVIERSKSGLEWTSIGSVESKGTFSSEVVYQYLDRIPEEGKSYYRLKQVDQDGSFSYSRTILLNRVSTQYQITLYPNPSNGQLYFKSDNDRSFNGFSITIYNMLSQKVFNNKISGNSVFTDLRSGVYFYKLMDNSGSILKSGKVIMN